MTTTLKELNESQRLLGAGRQVQRRLDCRILEARILELHAKGENDILATMIIEELNNLRDKITASGRTS